MKRGNFLILAFLILLLWLIILASGCTNPTESFFFPGVIKIDKGETVRIGKVEGKDLFIRYEGWNGNWYIIRYTGLYESLGTPLSNLMALPPEENYPQVKYFHLASYQYKIKLLAVDREKLMLIILERVR